MGSVAKYGLRAPRAPGSITTTGGGPRRSQRLRSAEHADGRERTPPSSRLSHARARIHPNVTQRPGHEEHRRGHHQHLRCGRVEIDGEPGDHAQAREHTESGSDGTDTNGPEERSDEVEEPDDGGS